MPTTDISTILEFRTHLRQCSDCELRQHAIAPVPWRGDVNPTFAVLGMSPGRSEDKAGQPFIGPAGIRLQYLLRKGGIDPTTVTYLNAVNCLPPNDVVTSTHIDACRKWMRGQVAFVNPEYLIVVGKVALESVIGKVRWPTLQMLHGKPLFWDNPPVPARPKLWVTYHPSAALRSGKYQNAITEDLIAFRDWREGGEVWPDRCYACGDEMHNYTSWGVACCERHAMHQGVLLEG